MESPRILLLEDDDELRVLLAEVLEDEGYQVSAAERGEAAVALAGSQSFDLIIADIRMEGMGGLEAVEQTQALQPGIGSLIVSGYASELETARAEHLDVGAYLQKPFRMQDLLRFVRSELTSRSLQTRKRAKESFLRQALDWALSSMAQALEESTSGHGSLEQAARRAEKMAQLSGCDPEIILAVRWAVLFLGGRNSLGAELPAAFSDSTQELPVLTELVNILSSRAAGSEDDVPVQIAGLALQAYESGEGMEAPEFERQLEERYSSTVYQAYLQTLADRSESDSRPLEARLGLLSERPNHRSLLSLAHTLERLGDLGNAKQAYEHLVGEDVSEKERVEGFLGLARLAARAVENDSGRKAALEALRLCKNRGPLALADRGLEAALLLERMDCQEAREALHLVGQAARSASFEVGLALVRCALAGEENRLQPEHLSPLIASTSGSELTRFLHWLVPHLFQRAGEQGAELYWPVLVRVAQDFSPSFLSHFEAVHCPLSTRLAVTRALASARYLPESVTSRLMEDTEREIREVGAKLEARGRGARPGTLLRVHSFGTPTVMVQGEPVEESLWRTRKVKYLFFYLACRWGETISEDELIEVFWPEAEVRSKRNLYWATSGVRSLLKKAYQEEFDPLIRFQHTLSLDGEAPRWHDFEEFRRAFTEARAMDEAGNFERAHECYSAAAGAYIGPYLDGCYYDFAVELKRTVEEQAVVSYLRAGELSLERNLDSLALEHATSAVELAPYREDGPIIKMRAQIRLGKGEQATQEYDDICRVLKEDYGTEPSLELVELYHRARLGFSDA